MIEELVKKLKADPNAVNMIGDTPLHRAAHDQNRDIYDFLVSYGANREQANDYGVRPKDLLVSKPQFGRNSF